VGRQSEYKWTDDSDSCGQLQKTAECDAYRGPGGREDLVVTGFLQILPSLENRAVGAQKSPPLCSQARLPVPQQQESLRAPTSMRSGPAVCAGQGPRTPRGVTNPPVLCLLVIPEQEAGQGGAGKGPSPGSYLGRESSGSRGTPSPWLGGRLWEAGRQG
jgi:hypothetical protein